MRVCGIEKPRFVTQKPRFVTIKTTFCYPEPQKITPEIIFKTTFCYQKTTFINVIMWFTGAKIIEGGEMNEAKAIDKRENLRVVTSNGLIIAEDLANLSLNARKLFYIAIAQCKKGDNEFYTYSVTPIELAEMWEISRQQIYKTVDKTTTELMKVVIRTEDHNGYWRKRHLFELCDYTPDKRIEIRINREMADILLGLNSNFSKPLMWDFMKMKSPYSMCVWHLMQREMHSFKPMMSKSMIFEISLEELRKVTGTENKLHKLSQFKERVLDKALREIKENCLVNISYSYVKSGRTVTGFQFTAENYFGTIDINDMSLRTRQRARKAQLIRKKNDGAITQAETKELEQLITETAQMSIEDYI